MESDGNTTHITKVFHDLFEHHTEEDREENRCQDTIPLHTTGDKEEHWGVTVTSDLVTLVFVQLEYHVQGIWRIAKSFHYLPHSSTAPCAECRCQINEPYIQLLVFLLAHLLKLPVTKHHVYCTPVDIESHWNFGRCSSAMVRTSLFSRILPRIFPGMESRIISR